MTNTELKKIIIKRIAQIEDADFLKAIKTIVESNPAQEIYHIPDDVADEVREGQDQLKAGKTVAGEALDKEIMAWLEERK
jgi:hypothetical protein